MKARKSGQTGSAHGRSGLRIRGFLMVLSVFLVQHAAGAATTTWLEDNAAGISASGQGRFAEAQKLLESAKRKAEASGVEPQLLAFVKNNLAEVYANQGRYADAEYLFKEVLATRKKLLGRCNSDTATTINDLAFVYQTQGRYAEAEPLCKDAVEIYKKTRGDNDRNTNLTTCNLGLLYSRLGRFAEAETVFKETLSRQKNALGAEHQDAALTMENLASVYQREGRYPESERLYKEALAIQRKTFGAHPHTATTLVNLALLYSNQGKYAEAELFCKESLEMNKKLLGENHPSVATSMGILAGIYESKSRSTEAEQLLKQALSIRKRTLGHEHPETATHINNLAVCYVNHGRYAEAEPLLKEALAIKRNVLGDAHPDTAALQSNLATVYERMGRYAEAETVYKNALAIHDKALGPDQPESATIIYSLALLYEKQHRFSEAESSFRRSLRIRERHVNIRPQRLYLNRALDELCAVKGLLLISRPSARSSTVGGAQKLDQIVRKFDGCQNFPKINPLVLESASKEKLSQLPLIEVALFDHSLKNRNTDIVPLLLKARESQRKAGYSVLAAHTDLLIACRLEVLDGTNPDVIEQTTESLKSIAKAYLHHDAKTTRQRGNAVFSDDNLSRYESIFGSKKNCLEGMFRLLLCNAYLHEENRDSKKSLEIAELACSLLSSSNHIIPEAEIVSLRLAAAEFFRLTDRFSLAHKQLEDGMEVLARVKRSPDKQSGKAMDTASVLEAKLLLALTELSFQQADYQTAHDIGQRLRTLAVMNSTDHRQERVKLLASLSQAAINLGKAKEGLDYANEALNTETAISGSSDERRVTVQLAQAQALLHNNRALESIENLQRAIKEYDSRNFANSGQTKSAGRKGISDELMAELYLALAKCQFEARKHEEARLSLNRAMDLTRTRRSQLVIPRVIEELFGLALCNAELGDHDSATNLAFQAAGALKEYISNGFPILSFAEQRSFLQKIKVYTSTILALCNDERSLPEAYWYLMRWRGMLVEALRNQSLLSNRSTDVSVAPIYRQWLETRHELARIAASQSQNPSLTAKVKELSQTKESLERQLLGGQQNVDPIAGMEVMEFSDILQPDEAFVDLFVYQPVGQGSSNAPQTGSIAIDTTSSAAHFAAIVVYRDVVKFVDIPHADKISQAIGQWREFGLSSQSRDVSVDESYGDGTDSDRTKADKAWSTLQSLLWLPVLNAVHPEATKLIICEDQELSRIPWSNMADQFSLGRKFLVTHVDSPRELVVLREKAAKSKTPKAIAMSDSKVLLVGDIEYKHSLLKLPGTALEVDAIEKLISDQNDSHLVLEAPPLRGKLATKDQVRRLLPDATIAHLGTHGFFAEDDPVDADMSRSLLRSSSAIGSLTASRNPLVSSGILLAPDSSLQMRNGDSNSSIPSDTKQVALTISTEGGDVTIDDEGRLTAEEIIDLDLRKCNLVVLSACNTGRGTEERGQGILGLRSAFMAAGTRTIMLSLWPVDDESTRYLMTEFYKQLWINKKCKAEALKLAQESVKTNKDHPEWKNPFYWAAWVLVGEGW